MNFKTIVRSAIGAIIASQSLVTGAKLTADNTICTAPQFGSNFTGVIVQDQKTLEYPPQNHLRITRCADGQQRQFDAFAPLELSLDVPWGRKICTGQKNDKAACYILARRESMAHRAISLYPAGEWVGGIFLCPGSLIDDGEKCTNKNAVPLWPMVSSDFSHFEEQVRATNIIRAPLFVSYDFNGPNAFEPTDDIPDNWASFIDVHEDYASIRGSRGIRARARDLTMNALKGIYSLGHMMFTIPTSTTYKDRGDMRPRRPIRALLNKVPFESQPEAFAASPKLTYLERPAYNRKGIKKIKQELGIQSVDSDFIPEFDDEVEVSSQNARESQNDETTEFSLGGLVELMFQKPAISANILKTVFDNHVITFSKEEEPIFAHATLNQEPSDLLDSINL